MGLFRTSGVYCTQCEAEGFRRITYFLDRPDILSVYTVRIEARKSEAPLLLSNGNRQEIGDLPDGWHYAVWHDPFPKPSYLFALVAGDLGLVKDDFVTASGRKVDLGIYVEHGKERLAAYAMDALKRSMRWDEEVFGREYDLDIFNIVAVSDFNMGAMENKGLNIFNDKYVLADDETATDADFANIEAIIAHEYFHNWTGNRITCRDWFQLCLKEGLTVFRDHEFSADQRSRPVKRIAEVRTLRAHQFPEDQGPLAHPVRPRRYREINNFYTATVYEKGSEVVRMIKTILGAETFRKGMDLYFERHDGEAATVEDFLKVFEDVSGRDLQQFALWYHQAGTPNLTVVDLARRGQTRIRHRDRAVGAADAVGKPQAADAHSAGLRPGRTRRRRHRPRRASRARRSRTASSMSSKRRHVVRFSGIRRAPCPLAQPRLLGAGHAFGRAAARGPVLPRPPRQRSLLALAGLQHAAHRSADRRLPQRARRQAACISRKARRAGRRHRRRREAGARLSRARAGAARRSRHRPRDRQEHRSRRHLRQPRGAGGGDCRSRTKTFRASSTPRCESKGRFSPDAASAGRRALRNTLLDYLAILPGGAELAARHFADATNMTDRAAALTVLTHRHADTPAGKRCARRVRGALPRRSAGDGQMAADPGDGAGRRHARQGPRR